MFIEFARRLWRVSASIATVAVLGGVLDACSHGTGNEHTAASPILACATPGTWIDPASRTAIAHDRLTADMAERPVVLLGEIHDNAEHHRWQLHTLAALHGRHPNMAIGFEAFPRGAQPVLERWVAGELTREAFLKEVKWAEVWGFDADLYLPLFHFARQHRVPMVALNVERSLVARVGREGVDAVPLEDREGVSKPAAPSQAYRQSLARVFGAKKHRHQSANHQAVGTEPKTQADVMSDPAFERFVEAQLTWDRAMAEAIADARKSAGQPLVVGILGRGHVEHRWGVPHQLASLGIDDAAILLPMASSEDCAHLSPDLADAVFVTPPASEKAAPRPRLGVRIETAGTGVRILQVMPGSIAETAAIRPGDVIVEAAGIPVKTGGDLIGIVQRQAPGTWLPLKIERNGVAAERVARFPPASTAPR